MTPKELWEAALRSLREQLGEVAWWRWLQGSTVAYVTAEELVIRVRDHYAVEWCYHRLRPAIDRTVAALLREGGNAVRPTRFVS